jgi:hypothetical protein
VQIPVAFAHTDATTTRIRMRGRQGPVSEVLLKQPVKSAGRISRTGW